MINRTMVRARVIQTLYAYYQNGNQTLTTARKELIKSYSHSYSLYMMLLEFINVITRLSEEDIEKDKRLSRITHQERPANRRMADNRLAAQIWQCQRLRNYIDQEHLSWESALSSIETFWKAVKTTEFYHNYMQQDACTYEDDKAIWKQIYAYAAESQTFEDALEDLEIRLDQANWITDLSIVLTFVQKTIKRAKEGEELDLLEMFDSEEELQWGEKLLRAAIDGHDRYIQLIEANLKNWDKDRVAYMDKVILTVALAEIETMDDIALQVSLNEYIEAAREYSSDKSPQFVNGILNEIVKGLDHVKATMLR